MIYQPDFMNSIRTETMATTELKRLILAAKSISAILRTLRNFLHYYQEFITVKKKYIPYHIIQLKSWLMSS